MPLRWHLETGRLRREARFFVVAAKARSQSWPLDGKSVDFLRADVAGADGRAVRGGDLRQAGGQRTPMKTPPIAASILKRFRPEIKGLSRVEPGMILITPFSATAAAAAAMDLKG